VHHGEAESILCCPGGDTEVVAAYVSVVQAKQLDVETSERDQLTDVREVLPPVCDERPDQVGSAAPARPSPFPSLPEVREVVERPRDEVVVRAEDEPGREAATDRPDSLDRRLDRVRLGEEVPRHDRDVRCRQRREEPSLPRVVTDEMEIGEVKYEEGPLSGRR
jgi:hypothetical protein